MTEKTGVKAEILPDLGDLLQCPVCYEIPSGQIFQCNEGHHVCGRCKVRLDVCPVCRALFFGTRNYAMEELIENIRKLRAFKLVGKVTTGEIKISEATTPTKDTTTEETENETVDNNENQLEILNRPSLGPPPPCKGLFRCLCCKNGNGVRLPFGRILNHLRYYHSPELIEGRSENGEYLQAWQFPTVPERIVTAIRVSDMGIFFLIIEIHEDSLCAWLSMVAAPTVALEFCYTLTISGNDREAIFSDCVWSVRSCEGSLKRRGYCLQVSGMDACALVALTSITAKLSVRRSPFDQLAQQAPPRAVIRVADRGRLPPYAAPDASLAPGDARPENPFDFEADARTTESPRSPHGTDAGDAAPPPEPANGPHGEERGPLSRNARRRLRLRLRAALDNAGAPAPAPMPPTLPVISIVTAPLQAGPSGAAPHPPNQGRNKKKRRQRR